MSKFNSIKEIEIWKDACELAIEIAYIEEEIYIILLNKCKNIFPQNTKVDYISKKSLGLKC